jgi:hypothetical protein
MKQEFRQDVQEYYAHWLRELANREAFGIEWHMFNVERAIEELNAYIENHFDK